MVRKRGERRKKTKEGIKNNERIQRQRTIRKSRKIKTKSAQYTDSYGKQSEKRKSKSDDYALEEPPVYRQIEMNRRKKKESKNEERKKKNKDKHLYLQHKFLVNETFGDGGLEVRAFEEPQEKLIDQL